MMIEDENPYASPAEIEESDQVPDLKECRTRMNSVKEGLQWIGASAWIVPAFLVMLSLGFITGRKGPIFAEVLLGWWLSLVIQLIGGFFCLWCPALVVRHGRGWILGSFGLFILSHLLIISLTMGIMGYLPGSIRVTVSYTALWCLAAGGLAMQYFLRKLALRLNGRGAANRVGVMMGTYLAFAAAVIFTVSVSLSGFVRVWLETGAPPETEYEAWLLTIYIAAVVTIWVSGIVHAILSWMTLPGLRRRIDQAVGMPEHEA